MWSTCHSLTAPSQPPGTKRLQETVYSVTVDCLQHRRTVLFQVPPLICLVPDLQAPHCFFKISASKTFSRIAGLQHKSTIPHGKRRAGFNEKQILCGVKELLEEKESFADGKTKPCSPPLENGEGCSLWVKEKKRESPKQSLSLWLFPLKPCSFCPLECGRWTLLLGVFVCDGEKLSRHPMTVQTEHAHPHPSPSLPTQTHHPFFSTSLLFHTDFYSNFICPATFHFSCQNLTVFLSWPTLFCRLALLWACIFCLLSLWWAFSLSLTLVYLSFCTLPSLGPVVVRVSDFSLVWLQAAPAAALIDTILHFLTASSLHSLSFDLPSHRLLQCKMYHTQ